MVQCHKYESALDVKCNDNSRNLWVVNASLHNPDAQEVLKSLALPVLQYFGLAGAIGPMIE